MLQKLFALNPNITTPGKEITAGITTFLTMSYILFVNPMILSDAGMDFNAVITATALAACFGTLLMAFWVKAPLAMAPGMGLNAFFAYTLVIGEGITWETAMGVVFISGLVFLLLTWFGVREKIVNAIPLSLRLSIPAGIGLFITLIGFQNMDLVVRDDATMIALGTLSTPLLFGLFGILLIVILEAKKNQRLYFDRHLGYHISCNSFWPDRCTGFHHLRPTLSWAGCTSTGYHWGFAVGIDGCYLLFHVCRPVRLRWDTRRMCL